MNLSKPGTPLSLLQIININEICITLNFKELGRKSVHSCVRSHGIIRFFNLVEEPYSYLYRDDIVMPDPHSGAIWKHRFADGYIMKS